MAQTVESARNVGDPGLIPGSGRFPGEGMITHSTILAWRIPWTESLEGYTPQGQRESDMTGRVTVSLSTEDKLFGGHSHTDDK